MSRIFIFITVPMTILGILFQGLLSGYISFFIAIFDLIFLGVILATLLYLLSLRKRKWTDAFLQSVLLIGSITGFFVLFLTLFTLISNAFPGKLSKITLSDGKHEIIYYQMSHIGTPSYYAHIRDDLRSLASSGAVFFIEGVRPGNPENQAILDRSLGLELRSDTYDLIAGHIGLVAQDQTLTDMIDPLQIRHTDLSVDDIVNIMGTGSVRESDPIDIVSELEKVEITGIGKMMLSAFFRAIMNFTLREAPSDDILGSVFDENVLSTLLTSRNKTVIDSYLRESPPKSVFLYGGLHFDGMYALLKEADPAWRIEKLEPVYPYVYD